MTPGDRIRAIVERCEAQFPAVRVDAEAFAQHVAPLLGDDDAHESDLYLAFACQSGDRAAWRELEPYLDAIPSVVARLDPSPAIGKEVRQRVAEKLLEGRLAQYAGQGPLGAWIRIVALREAQTLLRTRKREHPAPDTKLALLASPDADPELALLKRRSAAVFERAYASVLASLDDETRSTLRLYFVDGLTFEQLGRALAVSRATAARRVADARKRVLEGVCDVLKRELGDTTAGAATLFAFVESQLQISVLRHFGDPGT